MPQARSLYTRVGVLILAGIALAVGFVLFLTSGRLGESTQVFETYVQESVTGLDVGAPVRYRGVAVGRVVDIGLVSSAYPAPVTEPFTGPFQRVLIRFSVDPERVGPVPPLDVAVARGLRARIATQGLTGVSYLELDFVNPTFYPALAVPWDPRFPYIPAIPSTVAQVTNAAEALALRLQQVDFEGLLSGLAGLLADLRGQLSEGDLARALVEAAETLAALRQALDRADLPATTQELRGLASDVRGVVQNAEIAQTLQEIRAAAVQFQSLAAAGEELVEGQEVRTAIAGTARAAEELRAALAQLPTVIQSLEATVRAARAATTDTQADLTPILRDLRATAANLRDATELIRRSPGQALFGAPPPPQDRR